jgi:hypothetical protein
MIKSWQYWQRNHFQCSGEMRQLTQATRAIFPYATYLIAAAAGDGPGEITPPGRKLFTINQNIWFSFTRDGQHYFLRSETVRQLRYRDRAGDSKAHPASFPSSRRCRFTLTSSGSTTYPAAVYQPGAVFACET